ncbi:hypothetical protein YC2023_110309 [Brassica napus]
MAPSQKLLNRARPKFQNLSESNVERDVMLLIGVEQLNDDCSYSPNDSTSVSLIPTETCARNTQTLRSNGMSDFEITTRGQRTPVMMLPIRTHKLQDFHSDFVIAKSDSLLGPLQFLKPASRRPGVRHSTFESLRLGRSSQSIASGFLRFWDSLNFKKDREFVGITVLFLDENVNSVIHGFAPVRRANHYKPSLKACSIVKVDCFEVAKCSSMYKITDHPFLIHFISLTVIDEVITGAPKINLQSRLDCSTISK